MFLAIIPAFNEQSTIVSVVRSLLSHVDEVVVIDDCSSDATAKLAGEAGATVLSHDLNRGQGAALETGHEYARQKGAHYVLHFDADGQFDVADIPSALIRLRESGADILFGSRFLDNRSRIPWFKKNILFPLGRLANRLFAGTTLTDIHNGFRILGASTLDKIKLTHDRMAHATELIAKVRQHKLSYVEHPVKVTYHEYGQGVTGGWRIVKDLVIGNFIRN